MGCRNVTLTRTILHNFINRRQVLTWLVIKSNLIGHHIKFGYRANLILILIVLGNNIGMGEGREVA